MKLRPKLEKLFLKFKMSGLTAFYIWEKNSELKKSLNVPHLYKKIY